MTGRIYLISVVMMLASSMLFYHLQNGHLSQAGGRIAFVKALWLGMCIFYWFILPLIIVNGKNIEGGTRLIYKIFLLNMLLRAIIELFMMYVTQNWHPYLGIGHNIFSFVLVLALLGIFKFRIKPEIMAINFLIMGLMFIPESIFAYYMLTNVTASHPVYFVPDSSEHSLIMAVTWAAVISLVLWQTIFAKRWLYAKT